MVQYQTHKPHMLGLVHCWEHLVAETEIQSASPDAAQVQFRFVSGWTSPSDSSF